MCVKQCYILFIIYTNIGFTINTVIENVKYKEKKYMLLLHFILRNEL